MNREIKFRAWDGEKRVMSHFNELGTYPTGLLFTAQNTDYNWKPSQEIMQFTGLKDKNGKEIYEGDIVKVYENIRYNNEIEGVAEVKYGIEVNDAKFQLLIKNTIYDLGYPISVCCEIIGNVYENPHALPK